MEKIEQLKNAGTGSTDEDSDEYKQFLEVRKSIIDEYDTMLDSLKNSELELADTSKKAAKSSSKSHSSAAKKTEDTWKKAFEVIE